MKKNRVLVIITILTTFLLIEQPPLKSMAETSPSKIDSIYSMTSHLSSKREVRGLFDSVKYYINRTDSALLKSKRNLYKLQEQQSTINKQIQIINSVKIADNVIRSTYICR